MKRLIIGLVAGVFGFGLMTGCGGDPCKQLEEKICKEAGEKGCELFKKQSAEAKVPDDAKKKACELLLKDENTLKMTIEGMKKAGEASKAADDAQKKAE